MNIGAKYDSPFVRWHCVLVAATAAMVWTATGGHARAQLSAETQRDFSDFERLPPHRAFALASDGSSYHWSGTNGADPARAIASVLKACEERSKLSCSLYAVNNVVLNGRAWQAAAPASLPMIGRLRPAPYWRNRGPKVAAGLIVWSHGYANARDATNSPPQGPVGDFTADEYDLYRFDRAWITDWAADATDLAEAVRLAKAMGYRRVILAGHSAGAWVSLAAVMRGAPADGVSSSDAAHHGPVSAMRDVTLARSEWQRIVRDIKSGPRIVLVQFANDAYDVGGRMDDARAAFAASGVSNMIIDHPAGFVGHNASFDQRFARTFGACIHDFIEKGVRERPCS